MSGQHCENYDVKQETVYCYPWNVDHYCMWSEVAWCCCWNLSAFFQFFFVLCCYITNHLMTGPKWNSKFCFPRISMFPSTLSWETLIFSGNKIHCSLRDQSLTVKYYFVCRPYLICSEKWTTNFEEQMMPVNKYLKHIFTPNGGYCVCYPWTIFLQEAQWLCSSRKYPCLPQGRLTGIPKGQGVSESQFFERKYDTKMEFLEGWGVQFKKPSVGGVWIFSGTTQFWNLGLVPSFDLGMFSHVMCLEQ